MYLWKKCSSVQICSLTNRLSVYLATGAYTTSMIYLDVTLLANVHNKIICDSLYLLLLACKQCKLYARITINYIYNIYYAQLVLLIQMKFFTIFLA